VLPFVSIVVPTRNRRPFLEQLVRNVQRQDYPPARMELLVADDGDDPVEDALHRIPELRYLRTEQRLPIGAKRNLLNREARGDIIVHMDDDDYYPPNRVSHAVAALSGSPALIAGASEMYIYELATQRVIRTGPFGPSHATGNTLAYKRAYLDSYQFEDQATAQEEPYFTEGFRVPMVQLDTRKTILCIAHSSNTVDKSIAASREAPLKLADLVRCKDALRFYRYQLPRKLGMASTGS